MIAVHVDRVIKDGDTVSLDGTMLRALWTPGHTQGATVWMTTVQEGGKTYSVAFRGDEIPNDGVPLINNPRHPTVIEDTRMTLQRLKALKPPDPPSQPSPEPRASFGCRTSRRSAVRYLHGRQSIYRHVGQVRKELHRTGPRGRSEEIAPTNGVSTLVRRKTARSARRRNQAALHHRPLSYLLDRTIF